ncbi:MAG: hypothetical protein LBM67_09385 [Lentimicrobiaceae bacterium]|jgi:hypothetical protein|nr:hypothetical protein [Lentimicrobiaceae bacterium]
MKRTSSIVFLFTLLLFTFSSCIDKENNEPEIPVFSYTEAIINPPDEFMIVFNTTIGSRETSITFSSDAVWYIEKLGSGRIDVFIRNEEESLSLLTVDTLALKGNYKYRIEIKVNDADESNNYFLGFTKTDLGFVGFTPTF